MILLTFNLELKMCGSPKAQSGCLLINLKAMIHPHRSQIKSEKYQTTRNGCHSNRDTHKNNDKY